MKKIISFLAILAVLYLGLYLILSFNGEYETTRLFKGEVKWQPAGCHLRRVKPLRKEPKLEGNFGGYLFLPLIYVDRVIWHRDKPLGEHLKDEAKDVFDGND